ncbi:MAG: transketolase C-terminal domain-containing protein [Spirochaetales bacterium]
MRTESLREAYGKALLEIFKKNQDVVVLDSDVSRSTKSSYCEKEDPSRYFEMGISEQNMIGTAAGLALSGKLPFAHSFAVFAVGRGYDIIRQSICIPNINVKIVGSSPGLSDTTDGSTHQTIEDIALMRVLPNMTVLAPNDAVETAIMVKKMAELPGPVYMRVLRNDLPVYIDENKYVFGKMYRIREGKDVLILANGSMVKRSLDAAELLKKEGVSARVSAVGVIKPLNVESLLEETSGVQGVVVAEEHSIVSGIGSAVSEILSSRKPMPIDRVGVRDCFGTMSYDYEALLDHYGLTAEAIATAAKRVIK